MNEEILLSMTQKQMELIANGPTRQFQKEPMSESTKRKISIASKRMWTERRRKKLSEESK